MEHRKSQSQLMERQNRNTHLLIRHQMQQWRPPQRKEPDIDRQPQPRRHATDDVAASK